MSGRVVREPWWGVFRDDDVMGVFSTRGGAVDLFHQMENLYSQAHISIRPVIVEYRAMSKKGKGK